MDRTRGRLRWDDRGRPSVITDEEIRRSHTIRASTGLNYITIERNDGPREMVADSIPVSVLGTLDNGTAITLRESMLMGGPLPKPQTHLGLSLIVGAHAPSEDALLSCSRFSTPHPRTWHSITSSEEAVDLKLGETSARLSVDLTEEDAWIQMAIEGGLPSHEWERRLWYRASVLMSLWINDEVRPRRVQLSYPGRKPGLSKCGVETKAPHLSTGPLACCLPRP